MINDKLALIKSTPQYTEVINSPTKCVPLNITAAVANQIVQISFPENPFKDGVSTKVLVGDPAAVKALLKVVLYGKGNTTETERNMTDFGMFDCFNDKENADASLLALEEVLPADHLDGNFLDYAPILHEFVKLRLNRITEYMRVIDDTYDGSYDEVLFGSIARHICSWLTTTTVTRVNNVRELVYACKVYDAYFCRSIRWLLTVVEIHPCDAVDTSKLSAHNIWFKQYVAENALSQDYGNGRVAVWELLTTDVPLDCTYSAEIFKYKLKICGVDIRYIE